MAGRGDRRAAARLVFGATVRMDFRGANGAKTCANREDDRLVILSRCGGDDVWLKTSTTSDHMTSQNRTGRHVSKGARRTMLKIATKSPHEVDVIQPTFEFRRWRARIADPSSTNAVSFSSACLTRTLWLAQVPQTHSVLRLPER